MLEHWITILSEAGIRVGLAAVALMAGLVVAAIARAVVGRLIGRDRVARRVGPSMRQVSVRAVYFIFLLITAVTVLHILGVPDRVITTGLTITAVILALALRQSLSNFATTVVFLIFQPFKLGDEIETMGVRGIVEDIQLFNTVIRLFDHSVASLPNASIQDSGVVNYSKTGILWATMTLTVGYDQDLARVREVIGAALDADQRVLANPSWEIVAVQLAPTGVVMEIHPTVAYRDLWPVLNDIHDRIVTDLRAAGIRVAVAPETQIRLLDPAANL